MSLYESIAEKLFGIELTRRSAEQDEGLPVRKEYDDGAAEVVTASGGIYFHGYENVLESISTEHDLVTEFRRLANVPEVANAIEEIVNDGIVYPKDGGFPVKIDLANVELSENIKKRIMDEFDAVLKLLEFDEKAHIRFKQWYIDGRLPIYIDTTDTVGKEGIKSLIRIDPTEVKKIRNITIDTDDNGIEVVKDIEEMFIYIITDNLNNKFLGRSVNTYSINGESQKGTKISPDAIVYATSGLTDEKGNVHSYLYNAIKSANLLDSLEESMVIYRISRAPLRRVFYIDTGNLPPQKAESYLQSLISKYKQRVSYDSKTGRMSSSSRQKAMLEDYWLPRREGGKGTEIDSVGGNDTFSSIIDELQYFKHKLYTALNVPVSRLDSDASFNFGKDGEITRDEVKFNKFINQLRKRFAHELFTDLLKIQGILTKVFTDEEWRTVIEPNISYIFEEDSFFAELKDLDILQNRMEAVDAISDHVDTYFSKTYIKRKVLFQTEEEIKELQAEREKEAKEEEQSGNEWGNVYTAPTGTEDGDTPTADPVAGDEVDQKPDKPKEGEK